MSHLVNLSDDVYAELSKFKKIKNTSYSSIIKGLLFLKEEEKTESKEDLISYLDQLAKKYKGKRKENISGNIDEILGRR